MNIQQLQLSIEEAIQPDFRFNLIARGQSRSMLWRDGNLPDNAPNFSIELSEDLLAFGYSLLLNGMRLIELGGDSSIAHRAFEVAAEAIEAAVVKGEDNNQKSFHKVVAASAYHLGRYSARAFSLLANGLNSNSLSVAEKSLVKLILRDFEDLNSDIESWFGLGIASDEQLIQKLKLATNAPLDIDEGIRADGLEVIDAIVLAVEQNYLGALAYLLLALEHGNPALVQDAKRTLKNGLSVTAELNLVSLWWIHRMSMQLLDGIWESSFHSVIPPQLPADNQNQQWEELRSIFIATLYKRSRAEIELWPSQLNAAKMAVESDSNLVIALPTSAGKTRIAEICILRCLSLGKRVIFLTPLRALSAQTEISLRRTFSPLGKTVSSLYGSIGAGKRDFDSLRKLDIVVATPEKFDFALRSSPDLLDDVGLVVLDEGHMIGLGEREVRYEAQVQRLLRRQDAHGRRLICLSAILPDGEKLHDFSDWLTNDSSDGLIKNDWRPTRLRFGDIDWNEQSGRGRLNITVGTQTPFVPSFLESKSPPKKSMNDFPSNQRELCLATAWRLMDDGQTVLIFCPLRKSVLPFAECIVTMHKRGFLPSVLTQPETILSKALAVGTEWFGEDHVVLQCLRLGIAIHHGELPSPYRKEIESLLRDGVLKLTISSPTLAQGLNLSATTLLFHDTIRNGKNIDISEFRNVVGRAGRAFIEMEGLVLYPMFDEHDKRRTAWKSLIADNNGKEMESGLRRLVTSLLVRMQKKLGHNNLDQLMEYVAGQAAWEFPTLRSESEDKKVKAESEWNTHLSTLDTALLSMLGEEDISDDEIEIKLDDALTNSLFARRLSRTDEHRQLVLRGALHKRARYIWKSSSATQRRGYFAAGVGLQAGQVLDKYAEELEQLLLTANIALQSDDSETAVSAITEFADIVFKFSPFTPRKLTKDWKNTLQIWLKGSPFTVLPVKQRDASVALIENAFVYNLTWAMEAVRVRWAAHEKEQNDDELTLSDFPHSLAVAAVETGTTSTSAALLIQSGFPSRIAAIVAVESTEAAFTTTKGMRRWLAENKDSFSDIDFWSSIEHYQHWSNYLASDIKREDTVWENNSYDAPVSWHGVPLPPGTPLRIGCGIGKEKIIFTADYREVGEVKWAPNLQAIGVIRAIATGDTSRFSLNYLGPDLPYS